MQVLVNTDASVAGDERLEQRVTEVVEKALDRFASDITRVEVHLSDENAAKGGENDQRCVMEARLRGRQPLAVRHHAATLDQAVREAADKLQQAVGNTLGRLQKR